MMLPTNARALIQKRYLESLLVDSGDSTKRHKI